MKIILALDPFSSDEWAVEALSDRTWPPGTVVRVLVVVNQIAPSQAELWFDAAGSIKTVRALRKSHAAEAAAAVVDRLHSRGLTAEPAVLEGWPHRKIVEEARGWSADLIILAPHRRRVAGTLTRSVTVAVLNHAPCSVEVLRLKSSIPQTA